MAGRERPHPEWDGGGKRRRGTLMRILSRYVFRQAAGALLLILLSLTGVVWIAVALRQLELMTTQGQDVLRFLAMTTLAIPSMMALIAPIALLIASIHVLNRLGGDSELIVMTAGGMPAWALLKPLALLALLTALGVSAVNHLAGPWAQRKLNELAIQVRTDLMAQIIQPWRFTSPEPKLTVHIRDRAPSGELLGLMMHDARDPKQIVTYLAERARIIKQGGQAYLRMDKGHIVRRLENDAAPQIIAFDRYAVDATQLEQRADQTNFVRPRQRYTPELLRPDPSDPIYKTNPGSYAAELHERFASPLHAFAFVLVVLAFMGQAQTTRTSRMQAVIAAFALAVLARILGITSANVVVLRPAAAPLLYAVPAATAVLAAVAIQWHMYPRRPSRMARARRGLLERIGTGLTALWPRRRAPAASGMGA
jgi:lipopolysaccharide export system permease protein